MCDSYFDNYVSNWHIDILRVLQSWDCSCLGHQYVPRTQPPTQQVLNKYMSAECWVYEWLNNKNDNSYYYYHYFRWLHFQWYEIILKYSCLIKFMNILHFCRELQIDLWGVYTNLYSINSELESLVSHTFQNMWNCKQNTYD